MIGLQATELRDGKFVEHGNDDSLSGEDMALRNKQLQRVEQAWRSVKSGDYNRYITGCRIESRCTCRSGCWPCCQSRTAGELAQHPGPAQADAIGPIVGAEEQGEAGDGAGSGST